MAGFLQPDQVIQLASCLMGLAAAGFAAGLLSIIYRVRPDEAKVWEYEALRVRLRKDSPMFRWFEPLIDELDSTIGKRLDEEQRGNLTHRLDAAGESSAWKPPELYLATGMMEALLFGLGAGAFGCAIDGVFEGVVLWFPIGAYGYYELIKKQLADRATLRILTVKTRLPYAIDLMAFMMQAGAGFHEALRTVVTENQEHVLGEEFGTVLNEMSMGRSRHHALDHLSKRLRDQDIDELVFAINKGEEMGTPLSEILRLQADQLRLKRSQWLEAAAGKAQVKIVFPGMLIMLTCLAIVMAPFLLPAFVK
jgi:tight adherence protein C